MPKITDKEPIIINGKLVYDSELDRIKRMYHKMGRHPYDGLDDDERNERFSARLKNKRNKAK